MVNPQLAALKVSTDGNYLTSFSFNSKFYETIDLAICVVVGGSLHGYY